MARAKRTDRAEARRRYRAASAPDEPTTRAADVAVPTATLRPRAPAVDDESRPATPAPDRLRRRVPAVDPPDQRPARTSRRCRGSRRTPTRSGSRWRSRSRARSLIIATSGGDICRPFMFAYFIQTPAIGGVFIAGFLAPRASWLLGVIVGLFSAGCYSVLVLFYPSTIYPSVPPTEAQAPRGRDLRGHPVAGHRRRSSPQAQRGIAASSGSRARTGARQAQKPSAEEARRRPDARRDVAEGQRQALIRSGGWAGGAPAGGRRIYARRSFEFGFGCAPTPRRREVAGHGSSGRHGPAGRQGQRRKHPPSPLRPGRPRPTRAGASRRGRAGGRRRAIRTTGRGGHLGEWPDRRARPR